MLPLFGRSVSQFVASIEVHSKVLLLSLVLAPLAATTSQAQGYSNYILGSRLLNVNGPTQPQPTDSVFVMTGLPELTNNVSYSVTVIPGSGQFWGGSSAATSFSVDSAFLLTGVTVPLILTAGDRVPDTHVQFLVGHLYSDVSGLPGAEVATFTAPASSITSPNYDLSGNPSTTGLTAPATTFEATAPYSLTAGSTYWFGLSPLDSSNAILNGADPNSMVSYGDTWMWPLVTSTDGGFRMAVANSASPTGSDWSLYASSSPALYQGGIALVGSAIPEPATWSAICGMAVLALGLVSRRGCRRNS